MVCKISLNNALGKISEKYILQNMKHNILVKSVKTIFYSITAYQMTLFRKSVKTTFNRILKNMSDKICENHILYQIKQHFGKFVKTTFYRFRLV